MATLRLRMLLFRLSLNPHSHLIQNPTGKIFSRSELTGIADILRDFPRVVAISDEVRSVVPTVVRRCTRCARCGHRAAARCAHRVNGLPGRRAR